MGERRVPDSTSNHRFGGVCPESTTPACGNLHVTIGKKDPVQGRDCSPSLPEGCTSFDHACRPVSLSPTNVVRHDTASRQKRINAYAANTRFMQCVRPRLASLDTTKADDQQREAACYGCHLRNGHEFIGHVRGAGAAWAKQHSRHMRLVDEMAQMEPYAAPSIAGRSPCTSATQPPNKSMNGWESGVSAGEKRPPIQVTRGGCSASHGSSFAASEIACSSSRWAEARSSPIATP